MLLKLLTHGLLPDELVLKHIQFVPKRIGYLLIVLELLDDLNQLLMGLVGVLHSLDLVLQLDDLSLGVVYLGVILV